MWADLLELLKTVAMDATRAFWRPRVEGYQNLLSLKILLKLGFHIGGWARPRYFLRRPKRSSRILCGRSRFRSWFWTSPSVRAVIVSRVLPRRVLLSRATALGLGCRVFLTLLSNINSIFSVSEWALQQSDCISEKFCVCHCSGVGAIEWPIPCLL